jgi:hypothetical protein
VPTLDSQMQLGPCLAALGPGVMAGVIREVIFADGGSTDDTAAIAEAVGARLMAPGTVPGALSGAWMLLLPPTTMLDADWPAAAQQHIAERPGRGGWFALRPRGAGHARAMALNLRAAALKRPVPAQGLLVPSAVARAAGGIAHGRLLAALHGRLDRLDATATAIGLGAAAARAISGR